MENEFIPEYGIYGWSDYPFTDRCPQCKERGIQDKVCILCGWKDPMILEHCPSCDAYIRHLPGSRYQCCGYVPGYLKCRHCYSWTVKDGVCEDKDCYSNNMPEIGHIFVDDTIVADLLVPLKVTAVMVVVGYKTTEATDKYAEKKEPIYKCVSANVEFVREEE